MEINFSANQYFPKLNLNNKQYLNLSPLKYDTVSFGAMKKSQFKGFDLHIIEKFKAPICNFNENSDLQNWAKEEVQNIINKDFTGKSKKTGTRRNSVLKDWYKYVLKENEAYTPTMQLLILSSITKGLKADSDSLPPVLNKGVLADTMYEIQEKLEKNPKYDFNFDKLYRTKLANLYLQDDDTCETGTKWVKIPSLKNDFINFRKNVKKLQALSHKNWCTKTFNAKPYLKQGEFHVYLENGKPKIGIRFVKNQIQEIQGELNNCIIPAEYLLMVQEYIDKNNLKLNENAKEEFKNSVEHRESIEKIKQELSPETLKNSNPEVIFPYFGIEVEKDDDGMYIISHYKQPQNCTFKDLGIDEKKLFSKVKEIKKNADFIYSNLTSLDKLQKIGGNAYFHYSSIVDLGELKEVGKEIIFSFSPIKNLGKLEKIGNDVIFDESKVEDLGALEYIGGTVQFRNSPIKSLKNLKFIKGFADFDQSNVVDLGKLEYVGSNVYLMDSKLSPKDFENVQIKGEIVLD